jgi:nucleotide-binding universal stress UspA family protein
MIQGATVETILAQARERKVDHIIVGAHHRSRAARLLLGSVSEGVLRGATCAVTVVPPHA